MKTRAQHRVLVLQSVEAVRAQGHHFLDPPFSQPADVLLGQGKEKLLLAQAAGRVPAAKLALAGHREVHPGRLQDFHHGPGHLLVARVEGARAAHPQKQRRLAGLVVSPLDLKAQSPVLAQSRALARGVAVHFQIADQGPGLGRQRAGGQGAVPAHGQKLVHGVEQKRALLHAGLAGSASPHPHPG